METLIGLSRAKCSCFDAATSTPIDALTSTSKIYLDEAKGFNLKILDDTSACLENGIWGKLKRAREQAVLQVQTDVFMKMSARTSLRNEPYAGEVGSMKASRLNTSTGTNKFRLNTYKLDGVSWNITGIGIMAATPQQVELVITSTGYVQGKLVDMPVELHRATYTADLTTVNPVVGVLKLPIDGSEYEFSFNMTGAYKENSLSCGCAGKDYLMSQYFKESLSTYTQGLVLQSSFSCNQQEMIDKNIKDNFHIKMALAYAVQYKGAEILINNIINSTDISRYTMIPQAQLVELHKMYISKYDEMLRYIIQEIDISKNSCLAIGGSKSAVVV